MIDFLDMTLAEKEMVLSWRNNENIKRWMYSQDDIKLEDHLSYIDSLEVLIDKQYLTVKKNDRYIGVIDFTNIDFENKTIAINKTRTLGMTKTQKRRVLPV